DRAEDGARSNHRNAEAATHPADQGAAQRKQVAGETGTFRECAHQHEQRDHGERVIGEQIVGYRVEEIQKAGESDKVDVAGASHGQNRERDRHWRNEKQDHREKAADSDSEWGQFEARIRRLAVSTETTARRNSMATPASMNQPIGRPITVLTVWLRIASKAATDSRQERITAAAA